MHFIDDDLNQISFWPRIGEVQAFFKTRTYVRSVPPVFRNYLIRFEHGQAATEGDAQLMAHFESATHLNVMDERNVAQYLLRNVAAMSKMSWLLYVKTNVHRHNYKSIDVGRFLANISSRRFVYIAFEADDMSRDELIEFARMQDIPANFRFTVESDVVYFRSRR